MSSKSLKKIEKELEDYAFYEMMNNPQASFLTGENRYAYLFQQVVRKAAREIYKARSFKDIKHEV